MHRVLVFSEYSIHAILHLIINPFSIRSTKPPLLKFGIQYTYQDSIYREWGKRPLPNLHSTTPKVSTMVCKTNFGRQKHTKSPYDIITRNFSLPIYYCTN